MKYQNLLFPNFTNKCLTFSYDDGVLTDERLVEIFARYNLKATFNLNSGSLLAQKDFRLTKSKAISLFSSKNFEIAMHGVEHLDFTNLTQEQLETEIKQDKLNLQEIFGEQVVGCAYPYGAFNDQVVDYLDQINIKYARTTVCTEDFSIPQDRLRLTTTCHHSNPKLMQLAQEFLSDDRNAKVFSVWGHSYEFKDNDNWNIIEDFAKVLANNPNVWYATNKELCEYLFAYEQLIIFDQKAYNSTNTDLYILYNGNKVLVPKASVIEL